MKLFCKEKHLIYPVKITKWVFSCKFTLGYLGINSTYGKLQDAFMFDKKPTDEVMWKYLRVYHKNSVVFNYLFPYSIEEIEIAYRIK